VEATYYQSNGGSLIRPFLLSTQVSPRGYSLPLQRRISDFGADMAFRQVNKKLQEHYGITVPYSSIRLITLHHANQIKQRQEKQLGTLQSTPKAYIISETDGSMVPIVTPKKRAQNEKIDRRKRKVLSYREARLTLAHEQGVIKPIFSATLGDVKTTGQHVLHCVRAVGVNEKTSIHCVGDGAVWIADQMDKQFGSKATYLIDFYHLCEYLSAAASSCAPGQEKAWLKQQKELLKASCSSQVLLALKPYVEPSSAPEAEAPVRACYRYMNNRPKQLDYKTAIANGLPIGSGELESAHRYIIQKRLKIAGAWWLEDTAEIMLAIRVNRENNQWQEYWGDNAA
jgi:hypothetical protein